MGHGGLTAVPSAYGREGKDYSAQCKEGTIAGNQQSAHHPARTSPVTRPPRKRTVNTAQHEEAHIQRYIVVTTG